MMRVKHDSKQLHLTKSRTRSLFFTMTPILFIFFLSASVLGMRRSYDFRSQKTPSMRRSSSQNTLVRFRGHWHSSQLRRRRILIIDPALNYSSFPTFFTHQYFSSMFDVNPSEKDPEKRYIFEESPITVPDTLPYLTPLSIQAIKLNDTRGLCYTGVINAMRGTVNFWPVIGGDRGSVVCEMYTGPLEPLKPVFPRTVHYRLAEAAIAEYRDIYERVHKDKLKQFAHFSEYLGFSIKFGEEKDILRFKSWSLNSRFKPKSDYNAGLPTLEMACFIYLTVMIRLGEIVPARTSEVEFFNHCQTSFPDWFHNVGE